MLTKTAPASIPSQRAIRRAWLLAFFVTVALLATVGVARSARAAALPALPGSGGPALPFEEEECEPDEPDCTEEEDEGEEECEEGEDGDEECIEAGGANGEAPPECLLTSAKPRVAVSGAQQRLRLEVRYTLSGPADVAVGLRSSGGKGALSVPSAKRHLAHSGSFHETIALSSEETDRALAAKQFTIRLHVLDVPWSCHRYDFRHLGVKHGGGESPVFSETAADLRAGR